MRTSTHCSRRLVVALVLCAVPAALGAQEPDTATVSLRAPLDSLVVQSVADAELEFAAAARAAGIRDAFLAFLAPDAVAFMPRVSNARAVYEDAPTEPLLHWAPTFAESASSDDLGYTTGPFTVLATGTGPVISHGWYLSIWRRNDDGIWQVVLDIGAETPEMPPAAGDVEFASRLAAPPADAEHRRAALLDLDDLVAAAAQMRGPRRALSPLLDTAARLNDGGSVTHGGVRVARVLSDAPVSFHRIGDGISSAGDLAYTYGEYTLGSMPSMDQPSGNWVRIWRVSADGQWRVVQMLNTPLPE